MDTYNQSKQLSHGDESGSAFAQEMLGGMPTAAVNFDRLQLHPQYGYIIFEYLLCEETQPYVTPWTSHPRRYWNKNKKKFIALFNAAKAVHAVLYLVNYAKKGTLHEDKIFVIQVLDMNENGITEEKTWKTNRTEFQKWFQELNKACLDSAKGIKKYYADIPNEEMATILAENMYASWDYTNKAWYYTNETDRDLLELVYSLIGSHAIIDKLTNRMIPAFVKSEE